MKEKITKKQVYIYCATVIFDMLVNYISYSTNGVELQIQEFISILFF
jgi:hypothetical protein